MKTAEQLIDESTNYGGKAQSKNDLIMLLKEYAQQVAEQVRQDCWDNIAGQRFTHDEMKQSILDTEIKLP